MTRCGRLLLLVLSIAGFSSAASPAIEKACKGFVEPEFCIASLEAVPGSASADIAGLQAIAHNLAVANATAIVARIKEYGKKATEPGVKAAVEGCLILYNNTFPPLQLSAEFAAMKHYDMASAMYESQLFAPVRCGALLGNGFDVAGNHFFKLMLMARNFIGMI